LAIRLNLTTYKWTQLPQHGAVPSTRYGGFFAYYDYTFYMFAGQTQDQELYQYDLKTFTWTLIDVVGAKPDCRSQANIIVKYPYLYLHNGWIISTSAELTDFFYIDLSEHVKQWHPLPIEGFHVKTADLPNSTKAVEVDGAYYTSGGWTHVGNTNASYKYEITNQGKAMKRSLVNPKQENPEPRLKFSSVYNSAKIYIFGGQNNKGKL
jgi:hypothetical protein